MNNKIVDILIAILMLVIARFVPNTSEYSDIIIKIIYIISGWFFRGGLFKNSPYESLKQQLSRLPFFREKGLF